MADEQYWRHRKRGSVYQEIGRAQLQSSEPITEGSVVVVYRAADGRLWARPATEFDDGRFEKMTDCKENRKEG